MGGRLRMNKTPEELYGEREKRIIDAIALKRPDRVPVLPFFGSFASQYAGISLKEEQQDPEKAHEAVFRTTIDFEPDMAIPAHFFGPALEALGYRQLKWAGFGLPDNIGYQFVEEEYMKADEYDAFLYDPTDFMLRVYWPRVFGRLGVFGRMAPLREIISHYMGADTGFLPFATPAGLEALEALKRAGEESMKSFRILVEYAGRMMGAGFPILFGTATQTPFDTLGDFFRGTRGLMLDMYRRPETVIAACQKLLPRMLEMGVRGAKLSNNPRVFIPLHKGQEGFMNMEQFKRFYWPTFRELLTGLVNEGLNPVVLAEGTYTSRLDVIRDVPRGKIVYWFEDVDMAMAKEVLGGTACIMGSVPMSLMVGGSPDQVRDCCGKLIDTAGRDGGYIMSAAAVMDDSKPENVRAMIDFTKEHGVY
jgi:uroporphyrinogen-III decarboxylase